MTRLCRRYGVTRAGYYAWRRRPVSGHAEQDRKLSERILEIFHAHPGRYGSPRIHRALHENGWQVSRLFGLKVTRRNQVWVGDLTYLPVAGRWWYLAVVMDQYSRRVLAWTLARRRDASVTRAVLQAAARMRRCRDVIFHSDRGSEYMASLFRNCIARLGFLQSASARGPEDNAHMESFFHSLKAELTCGVEFTTHGYLHRSLRRYMRYYNGKRMHSALGYRSPVAFEHGAA